MGKLTDGARKSFYKYGRSQNVPQWYKYSYFLGFFIIAIALFISYFENDSNQTNNNLTDKSNLYINTKPIETSKDSNDKTLEQIESNLSTTYKIKDIDGTVYNIPTEAYNVAKLAALAFFTGDWDKVPTYGDKPRTSFSEKNIKITNSTLITSDDTSVSILFTYTRDKNIKENNIQIIVYNIDNKWVFSE
jgi:hypothetical protein